MSKVLALLLFASGVVGCGPSWAEGPTGEIPLHEWRLPQLSNGAARALRSGRELKLEIRLGRGKGLPWKAEAVWSLPPEFRLGFQDWGSRIELSAEVWLDEPLLSPKRHHRARLFLVDTEGRRQYLPNHGIGGALQWSALSGRVVRDFPVPLGFTDPGFRPDQVRALGINFEAGGYEGEVRQGWVTLRGLRLNERGLGGVRAPLPRDPEILAQEPARAARLASRWKELYGAWPGERQVSGVNLAWPSVRSPEGKLLHLYGSFLHAAEPWYGVHWDLARSADVVASVRADFAAIRALFGSRALVRIFLFADLRSGIEFSAEGMPVGVNEMAYASLDRLFQLAREEEVTLMPVFFDFLMADGRAGPPNAGNPHWVGEAPELITDERKRRALLQVLGEMVQRYRNEPSLLAWDVMNEPENAVAVVTPEHFQSLQVFLRDAVETIQAHGVLATVGHRNPFDARDYFHGVLASSLGQVHYYPVLETRPAPFGLDWDLSQGFGGIPAGWGELPARAGRIQRDLASMSFGRSIYRLFWSWRGDDENGDGFEVRSRSEEIRRALRNGY